MMWVKLPIIAVVAVLAGSASAADGPDLIFRQSTKWRMLTPNDKLATYAIDDPAVDGVACYFTVPERGGVAGALGFAEEVSDISLACRQVGPIKFKEKSDQAGSCSANAGRSSLSECRSSGAVMPSGTRWSTWFIPTS